MQKTAVSYGFGAICVLSLATCYIIFIKHWRVLLQGFMGIKCYDCSPFARSECLDDCFQFPSPTRVRYGGRLFLLWLALESNVSVTQGYPQVDLSVKGWGVKLENIKYLCLVKWFPHPSGLWIGFFPPDLCVCAVHILLCGRCFCTEWHAIEEAGSVPGEIEPGCWGWNHSAGHGIWTDDQLITGI